MKTTTTMPIVRAYALVGDFDESIKYAISHFTAQNGRLPAALWLHPDRIPTDWPAAWPPALPNHYLNRNIVGLEPPATVVQPQLLPLPER